MSKSRAYDAAPEPQTVFLKTEGISEAQGLTYAMHWPFRQFETARNLRHTALYSRLKEAGACFGEVAGWERPNWFANPGQEAKYDYSFGRQNWFANAAAEVKATRDAVGLLRTIDHGQVSGPRS